MTVLVSGYYGFGNLGDEALLSGMLSELRTERLTVLSQYPARTRALHGVGSVHRLTGLSALLGHDALISGGGGLLQDRTSSRSLRYYLGVIALAKRLGKRVVVFGQSVGPLSAHGEQRVARALRGVPVAVRDRPSQHLLGRLGIPAVLVADTALLLPKPLAQPGVNAPVLLIPRGGYPHITEALGRLAQRLHAERVPLTGLVLQPGEDSAALAQLERLAPSLERLSAATPQHALELVAGARHVVSARLHGLILAARAGRPFSGIAYDPKVAAFLTESGRRVFPASPDPEALLEDVFGAPCDASQVAALEARARSGVRWLSETLGRN